MPVRVNMPVGITIPNTLDSATLVDIETRTGNAVSNACRVLREAQLDRRGSMRPIVIDRPLTHFTRPLDDAMRVLVERAVDNGIAYGLQASGLLDLRDTPPEVLALSGAPVQERFDSTRVVGGGYEIPIYDKGRKGKVKKKKKTPPMALSLALRKAWDAHLARFGREWNPKVYGYPGVYGTFEHDGQVHTNALIYITNIHAFDEQNHPLDVQWRSARISVFSVDDEGKNVKHIGMAGTMDHRVLQTTGKKATKQVVTQELETLWREYPDIAPKPAAQTKTIELAVNPDGYIYRIDGGGHPYIITIPLGADGQPVLPSPIRFITISSDNDGEGKGGGGDGETDGTGEGGKGKGKGRGGKAEGEGAHWPVVATDGEKLVCEPFLGEPAVTALHADAEDLEADMRALAAKLEVPYCGYPGKFAVNAAKAVGARAYAIGVRSAQSASCTTMTVRLDETGKTGAVDIEPEMTPEVLWLQLLGEVAVEIDELAKSIVSSYLSPENESLIHWDEEREYKPDARHWALEFLVEFGRALEMGCTRLYAECCRVVLLQQLRSSRRSIENRQKNFDDTFAYFADALDILGGSAQKIAALRRALDHANEHYLTGTVKEVLSYAPPTTHHDREGFDVEDPAPIDYMPKVLVDAVGDGKVEWQGAERIVTWQSRKWTSKDLEMAYALRRGMLNRVDPLFLQIEDIGVLYSMFVRDRESVRRYLEKLLAELLEANGDTMEKTAEPEDGAFFALEASQYVRAQHGFNARGLRFDLQGIHKIADDLLRPYADGTDAYRRGINRAIGIKAGWDSFVAVFSTAGIIVLAIVCAPAGAIVAGAVVGLVGLALTARDWMEYKRLEDLYRGLEDPEAILKWQEVELAHLMAMLSTAFSIFDVVGVAKGAKLLVREAMDGMRLAVREGATVAAMATARNARKAVLENMAKGILENAAKQAVMQAVLLAAIDLMMPVILQPILVPYIRRIAVAHGTLEEVDAILGPVTKGQPALPEPLLLEDDIEFPEDETDSADSEELDEYGEFDGADFGDLHEFDVAMEGAAP